MIGGEALKQLPKAARFRTTDRFFRRAEGIASLGADLNADQRGAVYRYEIELAGAGAGVRGDDPVSLFLQVLARKTLAERSEGKPSPGQASTGSARPCTDLPW